MMLGTLVSYFVIQGSAFAVDRPEDRAGLRTDAEVQEHVDSESRLETPYALAGLVICVVEFAYHLFDQSRSAGALEGLVDDMIVEAYVDDLKAGQSFNPRRHGEVQGQHVGIAVERRPRGGFDQWPGPLGDTAHVQDLAPVLHQVRH
ncbi:unnamed protein product [Prorocentrum cordatum]|uniref:Uncharacterized protein n=1 Tax=Prorocentrum cordatum TaxID=2364126 RepID=A0ABN9QUD2_9DINO|nr:unnamed protein product [Polarella glacialis]